MADYWEVFQGDLQDYMFYLTFVLPGILYSFVLSVLLNVKNVSLGSRITFMMSNSVLWILLYVFCLKGYIEGYFSEGTLQILIVICGLAGATAIGGLSRVFFKIDEIPFYYLAGIGMAAVLIAQFVVAPLVSIFFRFEILQISGIIVFFWQLGIGLYYWYNLYSRSMLVSSMK